VLIALWFAGPWFREEIMRHATHGVALALAETLQVPAPNPASLCSEPVCLLIEIDSVDQDIRRETPQGPRFWITVSLPVLVKSS